MQPSGLSSPIVRAPAWRVHCLILQLLAAPLFCDLVLQKGLLVAPSRDLKGAFTFSGEGLGRDSDSN